MQCSMVRVASTTNITNKVKNAPQAIKQSFANDDLREKINLEVKRAQERIWTVPNILTVSRIAITPLTGYFIWNGMTTPALACIAVAATTDLLDGLIARKFKQSSTVGAILDPIADKLFLTTCFIGLCHTGQLPYWLIKGFILRDLVLLVGGAYLRYYSFDDGTSWKKRLDFKNHPTIGFEPTYVSKINTCIQLGLVMWSLVLPPQCDSWGLFSLECTAALTTAYSLAEYINRFCLPSNNPRKFLRKPN